MELRRSPDFRLVAMCCMMLSAGWHAEAGRDRPADNIRWLKSSSAMLATTLTTLWIIMTQEWVSQEKRASCLSCHLQNSGLLMRQRNP